MVLLEGERPPAELGARVPLRPGALGDRDRPELILRRAGYIVVRYTWEQVTQRPDELVADLVALLGLPSDS